MSRETDYELFMKLLDERDIFQRELLRRRKAGRQGDLQCNKAAPPEFVFLNIKLDAEFIELPASHYKPDRRGLLEFDYVSQSHVSEICPIASEEEVAQFYAPKSELRRKWFDKQDELRCEAEVMRFKLEVERKQNASAKSSIISDSNNAAENSDNTEAIISEVEMDAVEEQQDAFSRPTTADSRPKTSNTASSSKSKGMQPERKKRQKVDLLKIEKYEEWEAHIYKALRALCNEKCVYLKDACDIVSQITDSSLRIEVAICFFRRVRDWHGYGHTVFKRLTRTERLEFSRRVGSHNLYDEICAVNYYELNLNNDGDRLIMSELTRLAVIEPGENMIDETYGGINFELPAG
jgi:hypothetical protein